jgi:hypothetical protein
MAVSVEILDKQVLGPLTTGAGGVATFNIVCATPDRVYRIMVNVYAVLASAGHLLTCGSWVAEFVVSNKAGVLAAVAVVPSSTNPMNFVNFVPSRVEAADPNFSLTTGAFTVSGTNAVLTVTVLNAGGADQSGVSVFCVATIEYCGAT